MQAARTKQTTWDLKDVLPAHKGKEFDSVISRLESATRRLESVRPNLPYFSKGDMERTLELTEHIYDLLSRTSAYSVMAFTADTRNQDAKSLLDRAEDLRAEVENRILFVRLWWIGLEDRKAAALTPQNPDFRYFLASLRKLKPHTLEEKVEQAVNTKNTTGISAWSHYFDLVTSAFTFELRVRGKLMRDEHGKPKKLVQSEVTRLFTSADDAERVAAYRTLAAKYAENGNALGEIYRTIVRDWRNEFVKLRNYKSPISPRNLENDVSDESVAALLKVCRSNAVLFQEFFRTKAQLLGMKEMVRYHIYAPLQQVQKRVSYGNAAKMVYDAFTQFDPKFADYAANLMQLHHVDSELRPGKKSGAYCMSVTPEIVPFILINYAGMMKDVYTLAHESGHAVHSQLSSGHSILTFQPPLVLAETASVFGEMLLFDSFMKNEEDDAVKKAVLMEKISSMYATIGRQAYFVVFEEAAHKAAAEGATTSELSAIYLSNLKEQFGKAVKVPDEFGWEWTSIPHIYHTPFYCYAYAFGNLLSLALYDRYLQEGKDFVPKYLRILASGGSDSPSNILREVGADVTSTKFWQSGFDVIARMVGELKAL